MTPKKLSSAALMLAAAAAAGTMSSSARADSSLPSCTVTNVAITNVGNLQVRCYNNPTLFEAKLAANGGTCRTVSADVIRGWQSLAQASLLSGKTVQLDYQTGTCNATMTYLKLQ